MKKSKRKTPKSAAAAKAKSRPSLSPKKVKKAVNDAAAKVLDERLLKLANQSIGKIKGQIDIAKKRIEADLSSELAKNILAKAQKIRMSLAGRTPRRSGKR